MKFIHKNIQRTINNVSLKYILTLMYCKTEDLYYLIYYIITQIRKTILLSRLFFN